MNDFNQVLAKAAITFLYNQFLEEIEPPFEFDLASTDHWWEEAAQQLRWSARNQAHFIPNNLDKDDLLIAFERMTRNEVREYMLLAISEYHDKSCLSASVESGQFSRVGWPRAGLRELSSRIKRKQPSRMLVVHNHPYGFLHTLVEMMDARALGPSSQDRDVMLQVTLESIRTQLVIPEFYVVENGEFRRIVAPSWERLLALAKSAQSLLVK